MKWNTIKGLKNLLKSHYLNGPEKHDVSRPDDAEVKDEERQNLDNDFVQGQVSSDFKDNYSQDDYSEDDYSGYEEEEDEDDDELPDDFYNPYSWDRLPDETEEEYEDRMRDQNDLLENLS